MARRDLVTCFHEPFGDAFYYGPEKISSAWMRWPTDKIEKTGRAHYTYDHVLQTILEAIEEPTKRVFLKDMAYHIVPPSHSPNATAPSLQHRFDYNEPINPTLLPASILKSFDFVFLIRRPSAAIPSLYRCFIPPLSAKTDEHTLDPTELGYRETRLLLDYLYPSSSRLPAFPVSPDFQNGTLQRRPIVIDADDLLAHPESILQSVCARLCFPYSPSMLSWSTREDHAYAKSLFEKYAGYHEDVLNSTGLRPKTADGDFGGRKAKTRREEDQEWKERYGEEAALTIRNAVDQCQEDYKYLRSFRIKPCEAESTTGQNGYTAHDKKIEEKPDNTTLEC